MGVLRDEIPSRLAIETRELISPAEANLRCGSRQRFVDPRVSFAASVVIIQMKKNMMAQRRFLIS
jgi:hypothetical protein